MIVYHGSDIIIDKPDILHSGKRLDFGCGFYVTTVKIQAERWARRKAILRKNTHGIVNIFDITEKDGFKIKDFGDDLDNWIDFVCECRNGSECYKEFDVIKGKVANDKVFRVVDMYQQGIWDKERAIKEIRIYESYDQISFVTQEAIDAMLTYTGYTEVSL